jgi:hypothetical protein
MVDLLLPQLGFGYIFVWPFMLRLLLGWLRILLLSIFPKIFPE